MHLFDIYKWMIHYPLTPIYYMLTIMWMSFEDTSWDAHIGGLNGYSNGISTYIADLRIYNYI